MDGELITQRLDEIEVNLRRLRERRLPGQGANWHARNYVFGADGHDWQSSAVSARKLDELEATLGITLPLGFRMYLMRFGARRGPLYGLFDPTQIITWLRDWSDDFNDLSAVARPFPFTTSAIALLDSPRDLVDGSIFIADRGCEFFTIMAVTGPLAATVWDNEYVDGRHVLWPARAEVGGLSLPRPTQPVSFLDWVRTWTEDALTKTARQPAAPSGGFRAFLRRLR